MNTLKLTLLFTLSTLFVSATSINMRLKTNDTDKVIQISKQTLAQTELSFDELLNKKQVDKERLVIQRFAQKLDLRSQQEIEIKVLIEEIKKLKQLIGKLPKTIMKKIQNASKRVEKLEKSFYVAVVYPVKSDYNAQLKQYLLNQYATELMDVKEQFQSVNGTKKLSSSVITKKQLGQIEHSTIVKQYHRGARLKIDILEVTQRPFKLSDSGKKTNNETHDVDNFKKANDIIIIPFTNASTALTKIQATNQKLTKSFVQKIITKAQKNVDLAGTNRNFEHMSKSIETEAAKIQTLYEKEQRKYARNIKEMKDYNQELRQLEDSVTSLTKELKNVKRKYRIILGKTSSITKTKTYEAELNPDEEKAFIIKSITDYVKNKKIGNISSNSSLKNRSKLSTKTKNSHQTITYNTIHVLPYENIDENAFGVMIFTSADIKELTTENIASYTLGKSKIRFVPVRQGAKLIYASEHEITWKNVKDFLEATNSQADNYFDSSCLAKTDYKSQYMSKKYEKFPAVCFKQEEKSEFISWFSTTINQKISIPKARDWKYIAANSGQSPYCWGNKNLKSLKKSRKFPENMDYNNGKTTSIKAVKSFKKSLSGFYDLCGNTYEMVDENHAIGMSFNDTPELIADMHPFEIGTVSNPNVGMRLFYSK